MINKILRLYEISKELTKECVLTKTHASKHPNYARKCQMKFNAYENGFECEKMSS